MVLPGCCLVRFQRAKTNFAGVSLICFSCNRSISRIARLHEKLVRKFIKRWLTMLINANYGFKWNSLIFLNKRKVKAKNAWLFLVVENFGFFS